MKSNGKGNLQVYYYVDLPNDQDLAILEKCLRVCIDTKMTTYELKRLERVAVSKYAASPDDIIKTGLGRLLEMFDVLKLKTADQVWLLYVGSGDIQNLHKNVTLMLLNKNPCTRECSYTINKRALDLSDCLSKHAKLENLKVLSKSLQDLFVTEKTIKYTNFKMHLNVL